MVRVELGGKPILDVNYAPKEDASLRQRTRTRTRGTNGKQMHFSWDNILPRLVLTSDTSDFDHELIEHYHAEGFQVTYVEYDGNRKAYQRQLQHLADGLELGDKYAIVAYGDAASLCLEACMKPMAKLVAVVAYYPPYLPHSSTAFPPSLSVLVHLAGPQQFGTRHPTHRYPDTEPGFAEHDLEEYDEIGANLACSRTLGVLRTAFGMEVDLEAIWDHHTRLEFEKRDADATMKTMAAEPYVNHVPTMTGGMGSKDLRRFYADYFMPGNPPDMNMKLLSRTIGTDRVVDELFCQFTHTQEIAWMLPGIPATGKKVEIVVVAIVCIRGEKLYHEHIHWDQASVLVQVGLLDPKVIPDSFRTSKKGQESEVERLPVVGAEGARKVVDKDSERSNRLIASWK